MQVCTANPINRNRMSVPSAHGQQGNSGKGAALDLSNSSLEYHRRFLRKLNNTLGVLKGKKKEKKARAEN